VCTFIFDTVPLVCNTCSPACSLHRAWKCGAAAFGVLCGSYDAVLGLSIRQPAPQELRPPVDGCAMSVLQLADRCPPEPPRSCEHCCCRLQAVLRIALTPGAQSCGCNRASLGLGSASDAWWLAALLHLHGSTRRRLRPQGIGERHLHQERSQGQRLGVEQRPASLHGRQAGAPGRGDRLYSFGAVVCAFPACFLCLLMRCRTEFSCRKHSCIACLQHEAIDLTAHTLPRQAAPFDTVEEAEVISLMNPGVLLQTLPTYSSRMTH